MLAGLVLLLGGVYLGREQIHEFVEFFIAMVESYGAYGYAAYAVVYFLLVRCMYVRDQETTCARLLLSR